MLGRRHTRSPPTYRPSNPCQDQALKENRSSTYEHPYASCICYRRSPNEAWDNRNKDSAKREKSSTHRPGYETQPSLNNDFPRHHTPHSEGDKRNKTYTRAPQ